MQELSEPLAGWLLRIGFPDGDIAEAGGRQLDIPELQRFWATLQHRVLTENSHMQFEAATGRHSRSIASDQSDPKLRQQHVKLERLVDHVRDTRQRLLKEQVGLQQQAGQALLAKSRRTVQAAQSDTQHIQVLALEAYAKRSEKLLQLLAELQRRLHIRLAHAEHVSTRAAATSTSEGTEKLQDFTSAASSSLAKQLKESILKQSGVNTSLPVLQGTPDIAAAVSHLAHEPAHLLLRAVAGNTLHATKEISTMTATLDLQLEAKQVQKRSMSGIQGIQQIVRTKQESHVKQFLLAEAALQAGRAAEECMPPLRDELQGQTGLLRQLLDARCEVAGSKAAIAVVEAQLAALQHKSQECTNAKAELLHKWDQIRSFQNRNQAMDGLIKLLYKESMLNRQHWEAAAAATQSFISDQLLPSIDQVTHAANAMHDCLAREQDAFKQVVLLHLPTQCASGEIKVSSAQLMLHRWQQALQDASACNNASEAKGGKAAADGLSYVLQQAARLRPAALVQSPDALLEGVVEQACQQRKYVSIQSRWLKLISNAEHAAVITAQGSNHIQQSVMNMWQRGRTEDIPHLKAVVGTCHSAAAFAENAVADAVTEWWTQPAVHAAPWLKHEGRCAAEWLISMRAMHATLER